MTYDGTSESGVFVIWHQGPGGHGISAHVDGLPFARGTYVSEDGMLFAVALTGE